MCHKRLVRESQRPSGSFQCSRLKFAKLLRSPSSTSGIAIFIVTSFLSLCRCVPFPSIFQTFYFLRYVTSSVLQYVLRNYPSNGHFLTFSPFLYLVLKIEWCVALIATTVWTRRWCGVVSRSSSADTTSLSSLIWSAIYIAIFLSFDFFLNVSPPQYFLFYISYI